MDEQRAFPASSSAEASFRYLVVLGMFPGPSGEAGSFAGQIEIKMQVPLYLAFSRYLNHKANLEKYPLNDNGMMLNQVRKYLKSLERNYLPSGSGFDNGTTLDLSKSTPQKLVFQTSFHHMNEVGFYSGWTSHTVTVTPVFGDFNLKISGPNRNLIKDHIAENFDACLHEKVEFEAL